MKTLIVVADLFKATTVFVNRTFRIRLFFLITFSVFLLSINLSAQNVWYVSSIGSDANDGRSEATAWHTIQYANDNAAVNGGDIIRVAPGNYSEYINVTKSLKFYGPNYNISPNQATVSRNPEAIITATSVGQTIFEARTPGTSIEVKGFKFLNGSPLKDGHYGRNPAQNIVVTFEKNWVAHCISIFLGSNTQWKTVTIADNFFQTIDMATLSSAIELKDLNDPAYPYRAATVVATVTDNVIDGTNWAGILLDNILSATVLRNVIRNVRETGIKLAGGMGNATVSENVIDNTNTSHVADVAGIKISGSEFTGAINITNNTVTNSFNGFAVLNGENITGKSIHVNSNSFDNTNTNYSIYHGGTGYLDATCNWNGGSNYNALAPRIFGPATIVPFLSNSTDIDAATPGFQPVPNSCNNQGNSPYFTKTTLTTGLNRPWEMLYGPDDMLWITQSGGRVSRVDPNSGVASTIYTAPDYFAGLASQSKFYPCDPNYAYPVSSGTFGLALHPDFTTIPYVYYIYSYNAGTSDAPISKYKVRRFTWNSASQTVSEITDIITDLPNYHYHEGMRLLIIKQAGVPYIYITAGDGTIDDDRCYPDGNDNLRAQDWSSKFGKILKYNIDGSVPTSNPVPNSPVFSKGFRNPLGLAYNPATDILYCSDNGKSTDDELNIIEKGKNYGWPKARGYHSDNNYPGEAGFVSNYVPSFTGDSLKEALYSWSPANVTLPEDPQNTSKTGVVAPSDMIYYAGSAIPEFRNCLLVTTLKNFNPHFRASVYAFKLTEDGTSLDATNANPQIYFSVPDDAAVPGSAGELRYRDITISPDGKTIFICTDTWRGEDNKIYKFTYNETLPTITYYPRNDAADLSIISSWTTDTSGGSGSTPADFSTPNTLFNINSNVSSASVNGTWAIAGGARVILNNSNGLIFTPASRLIVGEGSSVDLNNKPVTLKSDATGSASIGAITGTLTNANNVTVERYISSYGNRAYRLLTPSVNTGSTIRQNWQENGNSPLGYGTHITGSTTGANGFDATASGQSSLYNYNPTSLAWDPIANTNVNTLDAKKAYLLYVRGDRTIDINSQTNPLPSNNTTLRATGSVLVGHQSFAGLTGNSGFNLITNPYPSAINWASVYSASSGLSQFYTYWDPKYGTRGGYVTVKTDGTKTPATNADVNIQAGQAFFVQASGAESPTVNIDETDKSTTNNIGVMRVGTQTEKLGMSLYFYDVNNNRKIADGVLSAYNNDYSKTVDSNDAVQIANWDEDVAINRFGSMLSIESRPLPDNTDTIFLTAARLKNQNYEWQFEPSNFQTTNLQPYLIDNFLNTRFPISITANTVIPFGVTSQQASSSSDRFMIVFSRNSVLPLNITSVTANRNEKSIQVDWKTTAEAGVANYEVEKSSNGQQFTKVGMVAAKGNATSSSLYNWIDVTPFIGTNYYRIKANSIGGSYDLSSVVKVEPIYDGTQKLVFPNPITGNVMSLFLKMDKGRYKASVMNHLGQKVYSTVIEHQGGSTTYTFQLPNNLAKGAYNLQLTGNNVKFSISLIKE
jgi:glucose/arabinose dehydrogenase